MTLLETICGRTMAGRLTWLVPRISLAVGLAVSGSLGAAFAQESRAQEPVAAGTPGVDGTVAGAAVVPGDAAIALRNGNTAQAIALFSESLRGAELTRERRAILLNDRGVALWRNARPTEAIADFNDAVGLYPEYAAIYNNRGTVLLGLGLVEEAIKDFDRAILLGPRYATAYNNRAAAHVRRNQMSKALRDYDQAVALRPSDAVALLGRGRTHLAARRPFAAERDFTKGVALAPKLVEIYSSRATARRLIGRNKGVLEDLDQLVLLSPGAAQNYVLRGHARLALKDRKGALRDFAKAQELDASDAEALAGTALAYVAYQDNQNALTNAEAALAINPKLLTARVARSEALLMQGDIDRALSEARWVLQRDVTDVAARIVEAKALEKQGLIDEAARSFQKAFEVAPDEPSVRAGLKRLGVDDPTSGLTFVAGAGLEGWRVVQLAAGQYFAINARHKRLRVPLEVFGAAKPRVLDWELKTAPYKGIGVLRYVAGERRVAGKPAVVEQAAVVDLYNRAVQAIEPVRVGRANAVWSWENGSLSVRGPDGLVSRYALRRGKPAAVASRRKKRRRAKSQGDWLQNPWGINNAPTARRTAKRRNKRRRPQRRRRKKKTLFNLIFQ